MATVPCPNCQHGIALDARTCPRCGGQTTVAKLLVARYPALGWAAIAICVGAVGYLWWSCHEMMQ